MDAAPGHSRQKLTTQLMRVLSAALTFAALSAPATAFAQREDLRIVETVWGFDGRIAPGHFNPVSVLLDNLTDSPLDGQVRLNAVSGLINRAGGFYEQPVYLAPNSRRWVQFYPYVARARDTWRLAIRTPDKTYRFDELTAGGSAYQFKQNQKPEPPVAVILDRTGLPRQAPTTIKRMTADIFPPYSTATTMLRVLMLDHVPDWETPRQDALLGWVRNGGQLHLLQDQNGLPLQFSGGLAALNEPFQQFNLGSGTVTRHDIQRGDVTKEFVDQALGTVESDIDQDELQKMLEARRQSNFGSWQFSYFDPSATDEAFLAGLRKLTQPEHAWWLILLLSVMYIAMIFPGCWILSQKRTIHFLATYGAITLLALVFSGIFLFIGQRGYGESTVTHALAVARCEGDNHWSVMQWHSLFVTAGDEYEITADDQQALFSAGSTSEAVDARVTAGNKARFDTDIPPFSAQTFLSRRRVEIPDWELKPLEIEATDTSLLRLSIAVGPAFPTGDDVRYLALYRARMYELSCSDGMLSVQGSLNRLNEFCRQSQQMQMTYAPFYAQSVDENDTRDDRMRFFDASLPMLVQRSLLDDGVYDPVRFSLPNDRIRLFIYTAMPEELHPSVNTDASRSGRVLYVRDLLMSELSQQQQAVPVEVELPQ
jgi:hypothetical protein